MRRLSVPSVLCLWAGLSVIAAALPSPAHAARDICVKVLEPVKSATGPGASVAGGQAATSEVWTVEVAIGDCNVPPASGGGTAPGGWPPLNVAGTLEVSSGGVALCNTTGGVTIGGPLPKVFSRFRLVYPPRAKGQSAAPATAQALPIPYIIRATAQVTDGSPANNQGVATFRFAPGGTASCLQWK